MINPILISALLYVFRCSVGGFVTIFLPIFFKEMGFNSFEIGLISTLSPLSVMFGSPVWGALADSKEGRRVFQYSDISTTIVIFLEISYDRSLSIFNYLLISTSSDWDLCAKGISILSCFNIDMHESIWCWVFFFT
jgi:MFS family permease